MEPRELAIWWEGWGLRLGTDRCMQAQVERQIRAQINPKFASAAALLDGMHLHDPCCTQSD